MISKPARFKRLDTAERALDGLNQRRNPYMASDLSQTAEWLRLTRRFSELTGTAVGKHRRALRDSGEDVPDAVADLLRDMVALANGPMPEAP